MNYETDNYAIIQIGGLEEVGRMITKTKLKWESVYNDDSYSRAVFLGQGCWDRLKDISPEEAHAMLEGWGVADSDEIETQQLRMEVLLRKENQWRKSELQQVPDLLWSMAGASLCLQGASLEKWFQSPIPSYGNRTPLQFIEENGRVELFHKLKSH